MTPRALNLLSCDIALPKQRSPEQGVVLQWLFHWRCKCVLPNTTEQTCCLVCVVFISSSRSLYFYIGSAINNLFSKGRACFQTASTAPALQYKKKNSKQTLSIGRNVNSKLPFPNFEEMLVQKEHGTATVSGTERPPASAASGVGESVQHNL